MQGLVSYALGAALTETVDGVNTAAHLRRVIAFASMTPLGIGLGALIGTDYVR